MTTAEHFRAAAAHPASHQVTIADVPWPAYKVFTLIIAAVVLLGTALVTSTPGAAVLTATAVATVLWLGFGIALRMR